MWARNLSKMIVKKWMDGSHNHWKSAAHIISLISAPDGPINCELCRFGERRCDACLLLYELISLSNIYWRAKNNIWSHASYANARAAKTSILKNSQNHLLPLLPCDVVTKRKLWVVSLRREKMRCMPSPVRIDITIKYLLKSEEQHLIARLLRQRESRKD